MSVLIKGMEMPKSCKDCELAKHFDGYQDNDCPFNAFSYYDCPFIEVPEPHGDLIDRDKLRAKEFIQNGDAYAVVMSRDIRNAPTVIPASEE